MDAAALTIAEATPDDSAAVLSWRNDDATRAASVSQDPVTPEGHDRWYAAVLADPDRVLYLARVDGERVGLCRFDRAGGTVEVSINLNPAFRGRGLAGPILRVSIERYRLKVAADVALTATIRPENLASRRVFTALGFLPTTQHDGLDRFVLEPDGPMASSPDAASPAAPS